MIWTNPGHQLDEFGEKYLKVEHLYLYGNDERAQKAYECLCWLKVENDFDINFVQDITVYNKEDEHTFCGRPIVPFQTVVCNNMGAEPKACAIALPWIAQINERAILEELGVTNIFYLSASQNRRDNFLQNFLCVWLMYKHGKLLSHWTNYLTTMRCNLNCKCCLNFNNLIKNPQNVTFDAFKEHIDAIFSKFDYLYSLHFTGGEPMLVKELPQFIRYIEENYKDRIFEFFVITNGTIIPSEETIEATKAMGGKFLIDDYSRTVTITKLDEIQHVLTKHEVPYQFNKTERWFDLSIGRTDYNRQSDTELIAHKDNCNSFLQEFADKKIYACCYSIYARRAGISAVNGEELEEECIEIEKSTKMEILEFRQGYTRKGYVDMCKYCKGIGTDAEYVPAAVQLPKRMMSADYKDAGTGLVSICVPIFNTGKYLPRCINSLLRQTYSDLEIILVDDGSTDQSGTICDNYSLMDKRVRVIHKENHGEASARNAGLKAATGKYVMFIDSDDEYMPDAVRLLMDAMKLEGADLAIGGYLQRRGEEELFATGHKRRYSVPEIAMAYLTEACQYAMPYIASTVNAKLFVGRILRDNQIAFNEKLVVGNDSVFMCDYLSHVCFIYDVFAPIYVYYKYEVHDRLQGMGWYYPDGFYMFAGVADRMIKLASPEETTYQRLIIKQYKDFNYALLYASVNEKYFPNGMLPYLCYFCKKLDVVWIGAKLELEQNCIERDSGELPFRLISCLIEKNHYDAYYRLIKVLANKRKIQPFRGENARLMILLDSKAGEPTAREMAVEAIAENGINPKPDAIVKMLSDDPLIMEQALEYIEIFKDSEEIKARLCGAKLPVVNDVKDVSMAEANKSADNLEQNS